MSHAKRFTFADGTGGIATVKHICRDRAAETYEVEAFALHKEPLRGYQSLSVPVSPLKYYKVPGSHQYRHTSRRLMHEVLSGFIKDVEKYRPSEEA